MHRSGTEAIRSQIQFSKREIPNITNSHDTKRTNGQPSEQLFPKNGRRTENNMNTRKVKRQRNSGTKNRHQRTTKNYRLGTSVMNNWVALTSFSCTTSPSDSEAVQNI